MQISDWILNLHKAHLNPWASISCHYARFFLHLSSSALMKGAVGDLVRESWHNAHSAPIFHHLFYLSHFRWISKHFAHNRQECWAKIAHNRQEQGIDDWLLTIDYWRNLDSLKGFPFPGLRACAPPARGRVGFAGVCSYKNVIRITHFHIKAWCLSHNFV